jgi:excinuclease ABC subunit A
MVIITGLSGSGKSTVAFDILFAEGQRRFLDSMSPYARQFVEQLEKARRRSCRRVCRRASRSSNASRVAAANRPSRLSRGLSFPAPALRENRHAVLPDCDLPVEKQSLAAIVKQVETAANRGVLKVLAPLVKARKASTPTSRAGRSGRLRHALCRRSADPGGAVPKLERFKEHTIDVVVGVIDAKRI